MNALEIFEIVITIEALGLMLFALVKLWYHDVYIREMFMRYNLFKKSMLFTFVYVLSMFIQKLISIRYPTGNKVHLSLSVIASLSLVCLSYAFIKVSSRK